MGTINEIIILTVTAFISGFFGWFFERRKKTSETQANEIENADKALNYYRAMVDDLGLRMKEAIRELSEARKAIQELEEKVEALTSELIKYKQLNGKTK